MIILDEHVPPSQRQILRSWHIAVQHIGYDAGVLDAAKDGHHFAPLAPTSRELTVAGSTVQFCCDNCKGKAAKPEGDDQLVTLFGDAAFEKSGFKVGADKE